MRHDLAYFLLQCACFCALFTIINLWLFFNPPAWLHNHSHTHVIGEKPPTIEEIYTRDSTVIWTDVDSMLTWIVEGVWIETSATQNKEDSSHSAASLSPRLLSARAANERFDRICSYYSDECNKTLRVGDYTPQDRLMYQWILLYLLSSIDTLSELSINDSLDYVKIQRNETWRRGSASHHYVKINVDLIESRPELRNVLTHEFGHIADLWGLEWYWPSKHPRFTEFGKKQRSINDPSLDYYTISRQAETIKNDWASYLDFVSGYAMKWIYEDFAESFNLYLNHHDTFKLLAQTNDQLAQKYQFMKTLFDTNHLSTSQHSQELQKMNTRERVWDTTKIN